VFKSNPVKKIFPRVVFRMLTATNNGGACNKTNGAQRGNVPAVFRPRLLQLANLSLCRLTMADGNGQLDRAARFQPCHRFLSAEHVVQVAAADHNNKIP
jgi:hypothetical protein